MKKYISYLVIFLIGAVIGMRLCWDYHFREATKMFQSDTVTVFDTMRYSRLELVRNTYELDIPKIDNPRIVLVPADSATIIYRDSVRYVTLPRQFFYTRTNVAEIFHSGIDSRIDSLNVFMRNTSITHVATPKEKKHSIGIGIEANYATALSVPIQLEYSYMVKPWMSLYGYAEYEPFRRQLDIGLGMKMFIEW